MQKRHQLVAAAVIVQNHRVFAAQRAGGPLKGGWEFPGGKAEPGETGEDAVIRELREELLVEVQPMELLGTVSWETCDKEMTLECYLCRIVKGEIVLTEHSDGKWLSVENMDSVAWLPADQEILPKVVLAMGRA